MFARYVKILLFLTSYCPLLAIIMVDYLDNVYVLGGLAGAAILSIVFILVAFRSADRVSGVYATAGGKIKNTNKYVLQYFMAYLIPLLAVGDFDLAYVAKYAMALVVMGYLYTNSDVIYINPTLVLMGYRIYRVRSPRGDEVVITKRPIQDHVEGPLVQIADGVYYGRRE